MLASLHIKNIAVIDEVHIEFSEGFNVLTGETGAGKSIIIDSINMVLGQRTSKELIRSGAQRAVVEAMFFVDDKGVLAQLSEIGIEAEDGSILIYRDLNVDGRTNARVNGMLVTAGMLKEISKLLINIHGQQDNQTLLVPSSHIGYLDSFAGAQQLREKYKSAYDIAKNLYKQIEEGKMDEQEKARRIDLLQYQLDEISSAKLKLGEEEELTERRNFLGSIEQITAVTEHARAVLYSGTDDSPSVHDLLSTVVDGFSEVAKYDERLSAFYETLNTISIDLDDIIYQIRDYADTVDFSENELDGIEERLNLINGLKRKYGGSIEAVLQYAEEKAAELDSIIQSDEHISELTKKLQEGLLIQKKYAEELSEKRKSSAQLLEQKITDELCELDMTKVVFKVEITPCDYNSFGCDNVEFLISTNAGEPPKPLSKIASGGEMSRIMLAIKSILSDNESISTLIFDEIDTGVSGRAAQKIAQKLFSLSQKKQVLCITHLAQIASMAGTHFLIEKGMTDVATTTDVIRLKDDSRVKELARIIGGTHITELTLKNAQEILNLAEEFKIGKNGNGSKDI